MYKGILGRKVFWGRSSLDNGSMNQRKRLMVESTTMQWECSSTKIKNGEKIVNTTTLGKYLQNSARHQHTVHLKVLRNGATSPWNDEWRPTPRNYNGIIINVPLHQRCRTTDMGQNLVPKRIGGYPWLICDYINGCLIMVISSYHLLVANPRITTNINQYPTYM